MYILKLSLWRNQVPTYPPCGCGFIRNHEELEGRIALVQHGECSFVSKVVRAEEAGAAGVIVTDQVGSYLSSLESFTIPDRVVCNEV
jgi:hypothetical protein